MAKEFIEYKDWHFLCNVDRKKFEDTRGVIRSRKSKDRQHNCQSNDIQKIGMSQI